MSILNALMNDISVQPLEKLTYQEVSSAKFKIIKKNEMRQ